MRDEVADLGAEGDVGTCGGGTDARLFGTLVHVLEVQESASGCCLDCGQRIVRRPGVPGRMRTRCTVCRPPAVRRPRVPQPCIGCGGDVGPLGRRGRVRIRCRPCRAQMGSDRERRKRQVRRRWCVARNCRFCAREFVPRSHHHTKRRVCYECSLPRTRRWPCADCGAPCVARGGRCQGCDNARRAAPTYTCRRCAVVFRPKSSDRTTYCSRACSFAEMRERRLAREARIADGRDVLIEGVCATCGGWFARARRERYCSEHCRMRRPRRKPSNGYRPKPRARSTCVECGGVVEVPGRARRRFCSKRCSDRLFRRDRRVAKRRAWRGAVGRAAIVRKYRLHCALCGLPIVSYAGSSWGAALDHIVPLACGGLHHEDNIQLAHVMCNSFKGAETPRWRERLWRRIRSDSPFAHWCRMEAVDG